MPKYLLIARDAGNWDAATNGASPEEIQQILGQYAAWSESLAQRGRLHGGEKLKDSEGRVVNGQGSSLRVSDGPHAEGKEVIGGYWLIEADSYDEAVQAAAENPHLAFGSLEVREIEVFE